MKIINSKMLTGNGSPLVLDEVLIKVPVNNWAWRLFELDAEGVMADGKTLKEFGDTVLASPFGYALSWDDIKVLSKSAVNINACILAAVKKQITFEELQDDDPDSLHAAIWLYGNRHWEIKLFS
ncbi:TPA: hypothetical protein JG914_004365 [Enterobacter hormaechei subsp. steigerwaltii]|nr:hypothetical protein [Enterobacter hormaechei subsp. steigerwaltii]